LRKAVVVPDLEAGADIEEEFVRESENGRDVCGWFCDFGHGGCGRGCVVRLILTDGDGVRLYGVRRHASDGLEEGEKK
jgi:hypothetical protein